MIKRRVQKITQQYITREHYKNGKIKKMGHRGVDLRSVNFTNWKLQKVIAPENMKVLRRGRDGYGNGFVVCRPYDNPICDEVKFIHVDVCKSIRRGQLELNKGDLIGYTEIAGNSKAHHLHFETWSDKKPFNPLQYFDYLGVKYK